MKLSTMLAFFALLAGGAFLLLVPAEPPEHTVDVPASTTPADQALIRAVSNAVAGRCRGIARHWPSFESRSAGVSRDNFDYRAADYGWTEQVILSFRVREDARLDSPGAGGHTLRLVAGGGGRPGITMTKRWEKELCDVSTHRPGTDEWIPLPLLKPLFEPR